MTIDPMLTFSRLGEYSAAPAGRAEKSLDKNVSIINDSIETSECKFK